MSVSGKLVLAIKMLLESQQYKAELNQAVSDTQAAAAKVEGSTKGMGDVVQQAVAGQSAAVRGAATAVGALGAIAGTAAVAAAAVGLAYHQAGQETLAFEKAIILTGNRAGVTSGQLADMARNIDGIAGTQANASAALAAITASGQVTRDNLQKVGLAAVEMERATGQSIGETAKIFASLGDAPVKASLRLNESMNYLTAGTYAQIKAAEDLGDKETAASIAQNAAADALRERAAKVEEHLGTLERAWRGVRDFAKEAWDAMLNVGREQTSGEKLETVRKRIAELENKIAANTGFGETAGGAATGRPGGTTRMQVELQGLQAQAAALAGVAHQASEAAKAQADKARVESAGIAAVNELGKANERAMTAQQKANKELEKYRDNVKAARAAYEQNPTKELAAFLDPKTIEKAEAAILKTGKASKAALSDVEKLTKAGEALTASLLAQDSGLSGDFSKKWESLSAAYRAGKTSLQELTAAQAALLAQQPLMKKAADEEAKATKELEKEREKALATLDKDLEKTLAAVAAQDEQNARLGLSKEAIAELDAAKLEMLATDMELQAANALFLNQDGEIYSALIKQANAYRELARAKREGGAKQASIDAAKETEKEAKKASDEWERAGERIEQSLTDSLMRGFESGKDFAKNLRDTVINMFKTMVLRPVISAIVNPVAGAVTGMLGLSGPAQGGGNSVMGGIQTASNLNTLYGAGSQALFGGAAGASAASLGYANIVGMAGGDAIGALAAANGMWAGVATGAQAAAQAAIASNAAMAAGTAAALPAGTTAAAAGAGAGGASGALAAIPGWGWALAGVAALGMLAKEFDDSGTYHTGGAAQYSAATGLRTSLGFRDNEEGLPSYNPNDNIDNQFGTGFGYVVRGDQAISTASGIAQGLSATLDGVAVAFGEKAGYAVATAFADDTSKDGAWGALRISKDGQELLNWNDTRESKWAPREFANGEDGYKEYLAEIAKDTRTVLLDMDLPSWADTMLESIGDAASMDQLSATVQQIGVIQTTFVQLGKTMEGFAGLTGEAFEALMRASGGFESLAANAGTYYENFYSEAEKTAAVTRSVSESLAQVGLAMPATRDEFRALVESQLAMGEAGAEAVAALLGVSGAFASVVPSAAEATAVLQAQAEAMEGLQIKLLRAQGNELAAVAIERQKELAALQAFGPAAVAMQQQIYGIMDAMSALESGAAAYFAGVDRQQAAEDYTDQGSDALSKFFGMAADASAGAAASAAQASADAASTAAASWRSAAQSIQAAIDGLRAGTTDAMDPAARYALTKATLDAYTVSALGGDADAASKLSGAANDFLKASESGSTTQAQYLRDRVLAEAKLASVMSSAQAQASVQDTIAASAGAAVTQLEAMNANLTGFAATLYELLSTQYQGVDKETAGGVATSLANMQADWDAYFKAREGWAAIGSTYTDASFGGASFTKLSNDMAAFTGADGAVSYLRESESLLDVARRIPELRALWEKQYGLNLPAYAVGTNYVARTGPALLHEGEAVVPKAFNPWAGGQQGSGEMLAELRALRQTNERLEARLASIEESNRDMATLLDNVTEGGNAMRSEVMA